MKNRTRKSIQQEKDDHNLLEKMARAIDPPGQEVSDEELIDPGANIPEQDQPASRPEPGKQAVEREQVTTR